MELEDKDGVLGLLDEFRADCLEQITGKLVVSNSARRVGKRIFETLIDRADYAAFLLIDDDSGPVGIITGYLCPMLRSGEMRAEVEEFFIKETYRGRDNAKRLMKAFLSWCKLKKAKKVNLESDSNLHRAHSFYKKYGFEIKAIRFEKAL